MHYHLYLITLGSVILSPICAMNSTQYQQKISQAELDAQLFQALKLRDERDFFFKVCNLTQQGANINAQDEHGNTALIRAAQKKDEMKVKILAFCGAQIDILNNKQESFADLASTTLYKAAIATQKDAQKISSPTVVQ